MRKVRITETENGYIVKLYDANSETVYVFTDLIRVLECITDHLKKE